VLLQRQLRFSLLLHLFASSLNAYSDTGEEFLAREVTGTHKKKWSLNEPRKELN
jgi:hypothetical protein